MTPSLSVERPTTQAERDFYNDRYLDALYAVYGYPDDDTDGWCIEGPPGGSAND